jgi:NAD(P)-dependent dehydrogenase (short-subunit alcohol dehydrogenase family)
MCRQSLHRTPIPPASGTGGTAARARAQPEGGAADIIAAKAGTDRDSVLNSVGPEMMGLATGRLVDPQEIADVVALLVSPRSASTTGSEFAVDAGFLKEL